MLGTLCRRVKAFACSVLRTERRTRAGSGYLAWAMSWATLELDPTGSTRRFRLMRQGMACIRSAKK